MALWILDTDHISLFQHEHPFVVQRFRLKQAAEIATTIVTFIARDDILTGWQICISSAALQCQDSQGGNMMSQLQTSKTTINPHERLSAASAQRILAELPEWVVAALVERADEIEYPVEAVVEMAIASFLDDEALGLSDCLLGRRLKDSSPSQR